MPTKKKMTARVKRTSPGGKQMPGKFKILFVTSEAVPFVKTGGLGDVCGALPKILKKLGHDVRLVLPRYWAVDRYANNLKTILAPMGSKWAAEQSGARSSWQGGRFPGLFRRTRTVFRPRGLYDDGNWEHPDNIERFGFRRRRSSFAKT